jgi:alkanesulfonate monooxygenase SsuD/methylene tetrahydromethanopterin reductase-like flavin-dependent oxidoreductase (luciferase family)
MKVSISITNYSWPGGVRSGLDQIAAIADDAGLDTLWIDDHLVQADPTATPEQTEHLEAIGTLGYLAARTERVRLGAAVSPVTFRPPAVLIKAVSTVDTLSGGRTWLGIGAGYQEDESRAMGLPFPPVATRFELLEDTLVLAHQMWAGDESPFEGRQIRLEHPVDSPLPARRPRILVGGTGKRRTLRLVAQYADACNVFDIPDGGKTVRENLAVLADHCADVGRPYDEIEKTIGTRLHPGQSSDELAKQCDSLAELGLDHAIVITSGPWTPEAVRIVGTAASALA